MKLASIGCGDLVLVSKGGRRFYARVLEVSRGTVRFEPIERGISHRHASAHELVDHWRHARRRRSSAEPSLVDEAPPALPPKEQLSLAGRLGTPVSPSG